MNYINQLQLRVAELEGQMSCADDVIVDLYRYLQSEKFHVDNKVNVQDIFLRLAPIRNLLNFEGK